MLYHTYVNTTKTSPIKYNSYDIIDIPCDVDIDLHDFTRHAYHIFLYYKSSNPKMSHSVVDIDPLTWANFFLQALGSTSRDTLLRVPNGCCTQDTCTIKVFYDCCYEVLIKHFN